MNAPIGQAALRLAFFFIIAAGLTLCWIPSRSPEFVLVVLTIGAGVLMAAVASILIRHGK